jgi:hypothetical protein
MFRIWRFLAARPATMTLAAIPLLGILVMYHS